MSSERAQDPYEVLQVRPDADQLVIRAAYRALAGRYHPDNDSSSSSTRRMAELNAAYSQIGTPERRAVYDALQRHLAAVATVRPHSPQPTPPTRVAHRAAVAGPGADVLDFGRYHGWTLAQIAQSDPDYLRWLARHSSGIRYRRRIEDLLSKAEGGPRLRAERERRR
jgi:curved DNA-binding protein CbpA